MAAASSDEKEEARLRRALLEAEVALKQEEARRAARGKAGFLAQPNAGLILGGLFTILTALVANFLQSRTATNLERQKLESTLIIKAVETLDPDVSSRNLNFLLKSGLISDPDGKIRGASGPADAPVFATASGQPIKLSEAQRASFLDNYVKVSGPVDEATKSRLRSIFDYIEKNPGVSDIPTLAYVLATIKHETAGTFLPIAEFGGAEDLERRYGPGTSIGRRLGNTAPGDGARYRGRGYLQITGRRNYARISETLGLKGTADDLEANPEKMLEPELAFRADIWALTTGFFSGRKLSDYITPRQADYVNARKAINGLDHAAPIAAEARKFEQILNASIGKSEPPATARR